jgi:tetratricopeptide (TPR) repeat protein
VAARGNLALDATRRCNRRVQDDEIHAAADLFRKAYSAQMRGELEEAVELYQRSIAACPTAEAHTFLGWTYSFQGRLQDAIAECQRAIAVDPTFGNPYNDIGAYLIELGRPDEAIPWLEKATQAKRYESPQFPWFNLGRAYMMKELYNKAVQALERALQVRPDYEAARTALGAVRRKLN